MRALDTPSVHFLQGVACAPRHSAWWRMGPLSQLQRAVEICRKKQPDLMDLARRANQVAASRQLLSNRTGHGRKYVV